MVIVAINPIRIKINDVMLGVIMLSANDVHCVITFIMPSDSFLSVIMRSVIMISAL